MKTTAENLINLYNAEGEKHGLWMDYCDNGQLWWKGHYVKGEKIRGIYF